MDQQTYNNAVGSLCKYANPSNMTSFTVRARTRFNLGGNQDYVKSLNDITNNMGSSDSVNSQWNNVKILLNDLSNAFSKL